MSEKPLWYVVHTYSGYENKVKANIEKIIENRNMEDQILEVIVPMHEVIELKNNQKKAVQRKVIPGYVLIHMLMNDETWYIVRNTRGVTSFVGPGSKPVPLTEDEIYGMGINLSREVLDISENDTVKVITGPFEDSIGLVDQVNHNKKTVTVKLSVFGRETPVELDFTQIQKI